MELTYFLRLKFVSGYKILLGIKNHFLYNQSDMGVLALVKSWHFQIFCTLSTYFCAQCTPSTYFWFKKTKSFSKTAKRSTQGLRLKRSRVKVQLIQLRDLCYQRLHPRLCQSTTSVSTTCLLSVSLCPGSSQSPSQTSFPAMAEPAAPIPDPAPAQPDADWGDQETLVFGDTKEQTEDSIWLHTCCMHACWLHA